MDANDLKMSDDVQLVDVRETHEWASGHLEAARHIPLNELPDRLSELDISKPVVTVCRTGIRSRKAVDLLRSHGFDAENLEGGMEAVAETGLPVIEEDELSPELAGVQSAMMEVMWAMQARFGDRERTEEEELGFMREFLAGKGMSPGEIEEALSPED